MNPFDMSFRDLMVNVNKFALYVPSRHPEKSLIQILHMFHVLIFIIISTLIFIKGYLVGRDVTEI